MMYLVTRLLPLLAVTSAYHQAPAVTIEQGTLSGVVSTDGAILEYIGIPYAVANISNRFQAPLPAPSWDAVFNATQFYHCPQRISILNSIETEDCLRANVYVPAEADGPLPVMVFIHGGAFLFGNGGKTMFGPDFLVKRDIILVTINYRIAVLGFLCLGIKEAPGNSGIKDQIAALRWVKKNIAAFGGDPDNITLFGQSAGAASVSLLLASDATVGLFERVISLSGSASSYWSIDRNPVWTASLLAKALGHDTLDPLEIHKLFSEISYKDLVEIIVSKPDNGYFHDPILVFMPCVERVIPGVEPAIDELPYNLFSRKPKNIPVIHGSTTMEGLFLLPSISVETLEEMNDNYLFGPDLVFASEQEAATVDRTLKQFYFGDERIGWNTRMIVSDVYTHSLFEIPAILETEILLETSNGTVYNYIFNYTGDRDVMRIRNGFENETGACHGDELFYLFDSLLTPDPITAADQKMIDWMTKMWTNFAKHGDPTPPSDTDLLVRWTPSNKNYLTFLHIDDELSMRAMPNPEAYQLWSDIYAKYRNTDTPNFNGASTSVKCNVFYVFLVTIGILLKK